MNPCVQLSPVILAMMEGRNFLSLKFLDKTAIVMNSLNKLCYSTTLCDTKVVGRDGVEVLMHRLVLTMAYPALTDILGDHDDATVIIVTDYDGDVIEKARESLYQAGDLDSLGTIIGFDNNFSDIKQEDNVDGLDKAHTREYVAMDVVHDYVDIETIEEEAFNPKHLATVEYNQSHKKEGEAPAMAPNQPLVIKKQKKESLRCVGCSVLLLENK